MPIPKFCCFFDWKASLMLYTEFPSHSMPGTRQKVCVWCDGGGGGGGGGCVNL